MIKYNYSDKRFNTKTFANILYNKVCTNKYLICRHWKIFEYFSGAIVTIHKNFNIERLARSRAFPIAKYFLYVLHRRLTLFQKVRE